ncbi:hypothetical protein ACQPZG_02970 (plasmid) [Streptomyces sp. CA-294286]|uniref:hypothetical protein n=1 Tax=Streptomyces sp. CA-294286 TaxID=3240070 RepID=UPI003D8E125A
MESSVRWVGAVAGLAVNALVTFSSESDVDLLYGFAVFGLCVMGGVYATDVLARPGPGRLRVADITRRRIRDYVPRGLTVSLVVQAVVLLVLLAVAAATATADATGRPGRALTATCSTGTYLHAPWPGPHYLGPALGGLAVGTVACALLLHRVTTRSGDDALRRANARATVGAWGVLVTAPLFAVTVTTGQALLGVPCGGTMRAAAMAGLLVSAAVSALSAGHCLGVLLLPQVYLKARS